MKKGKKNKKAILSVVLTILLSSLISLFSFSSGSFSEYGYVDAISYASRRERLKNGVDFTYAEAVPTSNDNLFNDITSTSAVTFDNYWHFDNRPNVYAFKKWGESINPATQTKVYPLSFDYFVNGSFVNFETPIISMIGNRWESDKVLSHLELETINSIESFDITNTDAIQDSVIISYELANRLSPNNVEKLIGQSITDNVVYLNTRYNEAHYNNSPSRETIKTVNIIGIFDSKSSKKMSRFTGDIFVFMFGGKEGTYNHCGQTIAVHFSDDDYANDISISQFLLLDNEKSKITFYDYDGSQLSIGNLQSTYEIAKMSKSTLVKILGPLLSVVLLVATVVLFIIFIIRKKTILTVIISVASILASSLIIYSVKFLKIGNFYLVLLNPIGSLVFLLVATILFALLLKKNATKTNLIITKNPAVYSSKTRVVYLISLIVLSVSSYLLLHSVFVGRKYFLLTELLLFVGMVLCASFCGSIRTNNLKILLRKNIISICLAYFISLVFIFGFVIIVPTVQFNVKSLIVSLVLYILTNVFVHVIYLIKRKLDRNSAGYNYMEISL